MDKLLQLIEKLRSELVPESPIASMSKPQLLQFIEESQFIERMRVFHQKGDRGIRSAITDDEDDNLVPNPAAIQKWRVGKLRKLLRTFHKATLIMKKYVKFSASRLRSHIKRNRYEEMLFLDDNLPDTPPSTPKRKKADKKAKKTPKKETPKAMHLSESKRSLMGDIIINTGAVKEGESPKKDCCCEEKENKLKDDDFFGLIQSLAPNLYNVLAEKAFLLDTCALDKKRMEANVCPIDCNRKAWDQTACCESAQPSPLPVQPVDASAASAAAPKKKTDATKPFPLSYPRYIRQPRIRTGTGTDGGVGPGDRGPGPAGATGATGPSGSTGPSGAAGGGGGGGGAASAAAGGQPWLTPNYATQIDTAPIPITPYRKQWNPPSR